MYRLIFEQIKFYYMKLHSTTEKYYSFAIIINVTYAKLTNHNRERYISCIFIKLININIAKGIKYI